MWKDIGMNPLVIAVAALVLGVFLGAAIAWFVSRGERNAAVARDAENGQLRTELARAQEQSGQAAYLKLDLALATARIGQLQEEISGLSRSCGGLESLVEGLKERNGQLGDELGKLKAEQRELLQQRQESARSLAEVTANLENERKQSAEKLALLEGAREQLSAQFKALAGEILEDKSKRFTEQNQANIGQLLTPLREKITEFQAKVEEVQKEGIAGRSELRVQIGHLKDLNERLSQDATNLVSALKGSSKVQGDWGEFILEGLLEASGLRKGHEYLMQESIRREDGKGARLDVVVNLPGGRHLVIDSKVSLSDYSDYCDSQEGLLREAALGRHLASVRGHLKGLSNKNYQSLYGLRSLDFVVMFVPIEPAFMVAIARDPRLWNDAWEKNVLLVSPSTLLFVIRTVAHLWRQEHQTQNAKEIARRGAALYDKFVGFAEDLKNVGDRLAQARDSYEAAYGKLSSGSGNLVRQAELLRELGVKPKKALPLNLIGEMEFDFADSAETEEEAEA
jgi:DNA recombination protein RmuC